VFLTRIQSSYPPVPNQEVSIAGLTRFKANKGMKTMKCTRVSQEIYQQDISCHFQDIIHNLR